MIELPLQPLASRIPKLEILSNFNERLAGAAWNRQAAAGADRCQ